MCISLRICLFSLTFMSFAALNSAVALADPAEKSSVAATAAETGEKAADSKENSGGVRLSKEEWNKLSEEQKQQIKKERAEKRKARKAERKKKFDAASPEEQARMKEEWKKKREERKARWKERYEKASPEERAKMDSWKERRKKRREENKKLKQQENNRENTDGKQGSLGHYGTPEEELARMKQHEGQPLKNSGEISAKSGTGTTQSTSAQ